MVLNLSNRSSEAIALQGDDALLTTLQILGAAMDALGCDEVNISQKWPQQALRESIGVLEEMPDSRQSR
jgi:hypothetical protein